ncbi:N-acetylgalactosamine kinase-like [Mizuhopecten yessoensis]|uniref:N-acetylgalactosamine kinase n=1 Tax=Mizuhopecten yessoensis TaxID=6573 RepID=A0A210QM74_MIZYE|nr:N-acetylgalactosamine kinase-like [Mizuhopecten yessoensis]OWF49832.1 N-acetylgalactosamine kinase [Mizuhopecten yessoensis]
MEDVPPVSDVPQQKQKRYDDIKNTFLKKFGSPPEFFARASGRVNIIGEHIDYCGYSVLPMAIEQDIIVAVSHSSTSDKVILANMNSSYQDFECNIKDLTISKSDPKWFNYFLCGVKGILEYAKPNALRGMTCMVSGNIPPSSGLSSSSALVCCAALATMHAHGYSISKKELSGICAQCERHIGTEGGGMDQAIAFMAQEGTAKHIEFSPLRSTNVRLPAGAAFVITSSCVEMNKAATSHFNIRVIECRLAAQIIAKTKGLNWRDYKRFGDVQSALGLSLEEALAIVEETFHKEPYTKEELCGLLEVTPEQLADTTLSANTLTVQSFKLYDRATHVFSEASRVLQFKGICDENPGDALQRLGTLMNASHASCRDLYECSCTDLDKLVNICVESGALGSRLTGAGWGGCAVSMVPMDQVEQFLTKVKEKYYANEPSRAANVSTAVFATQPGGGAAIYKV